MKSVLPTEAQLQAALDKLKNKDEHFDERVEFGRFLMRHISSLNVDEMARYRELEKILNINP